MLLLFLAEDLHQAHPRHILGKKAVDAPGERFEQHEVAPQPPAHQHRDQRDQRHHGKRRQRQPPVDPQHHRDDADEHENILKQIHQHVGKQLVQGLNVVGRARDQPPGGEAIQRRHGHVLDVREHPAADVHQDALPHAVDLDRLGHAQQRRQRRAQKIGKRKEPHRVPAAVRPPRRQVPVDHDFKDIGLDQLRRVDEQHHQKAQDQVFELRF